MCAGALPPCALRGCSACTQWHTDPSLIPLCPCTLANRALHTLPQGTRSSPQAQCTLLTLQLIRSCQLTMEWDGEDHRDETCSTSSPKCSSFFRCPHLPRLSLVQHCSVLALPEQH